MIYLFLNGPCRNQKDRFTLSRLPWTRNPCYSLIGLGLSPHWIKHNALIGTREGETFSTFIDRQKHNVEHGLFTIKVIDKELELIHACLSIDATCINSLQI